MSPWRIAPAALLLAMISGCGNSKYVAVSGTVTYNGEPLSGVQVLYQPMAANGLDAGGVGSFAMTDDAGRYVLEASTSSPTKGALIGKHQVRIAFPPKPGEVAPADSDSAGANKTKSPKTQLQPIPVKYNTESTLTFDVPSGGTTTADFKLEGPPLAKSPSK